MSGPLQECLPPFPLLLLLLLPFFPALNQMNGEMRSGQGEEVEEGGRKLFVNIFVEAAMEVAVDGWMDGCRASFNDKQQHDQKRKLCRSSFPINAFERSFPRGTRHLRKHAAAAATATQHSAIVCVLKAGKVPFEQSAGKEEEEKTKRSEPSQR